MPSGGARARSGPPPSPTSGRSDARGLSFRVLSAADRVGKKPPKFPLPKNVLTGVDEDGVRYVLEERSKARNSRESALWRWAWQQPQAVVWEEQPWFTYLVAQWVRMSVFCETEEAKAADKTTMLRLADQIGMTPTGLALNGWQIGGESQAAEASSSSSHRRRSSRDRIGFQVVTGGGR